MNGGLSRVLSAFLVAAFLVSPLSGTDPSDGPAVRFAISPAVSDGDVTVSLDFQNLLIQGWSFGVCHDPAAARIAAFRPSEALSTVRGGAPPEFMILQEASDGSRAGIIQAAVLSLEAIATLPDGEGGFPLLDISYEVLAESPIDVCAGLQGRGQPVAVAVTALGQTQGLDAPAAAQLIQKPYAGKLAYRADPPESSEVVTVKLAAEEIAVQGWSFALCHTAMAAEVLELATAPALEEVLAGEPPAFVRNEVVPLDAFVAVTQAVVLGDAIDPVAAGPFPDGLPVLGIRYRVHEEDTLKFCDGFGGVTLDSRVVVDGIGYVPRVRLGAKLVTGALGARFIRGDADLSRKLDITDALFTLRALFLGEGSLPCLDAADSNDVGRVDISDPIFSLRYLFLGGPAPPSPYPDPGEDLSPETALGCDRGV
jgi:hypothetical protein